MDTKKLSNRKINEPPSTPEERYPVSFSIFALARTHRALAGRMLKRIGLFPGQEILLMQLWKQDGQSQNNLSQTLKLDHSTIAKSIRRLEEKGLVSRKRSQEDGRITIVTLTESGWKLEHSVSEIWSRLEAQTTEGFTDQEKKQFVELLQKVEARVESDWKSNSL